MTLRKIGRINVPTEPVSRATRITGFTFKSYDKNAGALQFEIKNQDGSPTDLLGATVRLFMYIYKGEEKQLFPIFDNQIVTESYAQGIVKYQIPDMLLAYEGKVDAYIYIDFPDGSHTDNLAFTFNIERSMIDGDVQLNGEYYFKDFQQLLDAMEQEIDDIVDFVRVMVQESEDKMTVIKQDVEQVEVKVDDVKQQIDNLGNLKRMYSNSIDFGDYDYSGNPNLAPNLKYSDARTSGNATISDNGTSLSYASEVGAVGTVLLPFSPYLPNKTYTLTIKVRLDETSIPSTSSFIGVSYSIPSSGAPLYTNIIRTSNMELGVEKTYTHTVTTGDIVNASGWALRLYTAGGDLIKYDLSYEVKLETGSSATPYQPNLLLAPYEISKVALNSNLARNGMTPITNSNYLINTYPLLERMKQGDSITITLKGTKLGTNPFRLYMATFDSQGANIANKYLGDMTSVDGLTDTWKLTISSYSWDNTDLEQRLRVYQGSGTTLGSATITWCKIERGLVATPPITVYKYFGEGLRDSNNPNDYSWNITPEYAEKSLNNTVSLTEPQSIEGLKNFEDGIQSKGKSVLTSDDMKTAVYTLTMSDVPDSTITELTGELVRVNNYVKLRCRVNASAGAKVVFRVREGYRENIEDVWEIPLTAISQADHKNQVAYYALTEANKREIRLVTVTAGNHFITGSWRTDDLWPTL